MSSNESLIKKYKLKSQKLYRRINLTFNTLFLIVSLVVLTTILVINITVPMAYAKDYFRDITNEVSQIITYNEQYLSQTPFDERVELIGSLTQKTMWEEQLVSLKFVDMRGNTFTENILFDDIVGGAEKKNFDDGEDIVNQGIKKFTYNKSHYLYMEKSVEIDDYEVIVQAFYNIEGNYVQILTLSIVVGVSLLVSAICVFFFGKLLARKALEPLKSVSSAIKSITEENLEFNYDIAVKSNSAVDPLLLELNSMIERLQSAFEHQKQFVSDVSHELRIPITIIQGYLDILQDWGKDDKDMLDESIESITGETINMKNLVERLLLLQKLATRSMPIKCEMINVNQFIEKLQADTKMLSTKHEITVSLDDDNSEIYTDREILTQALRAIIDNSIKYTPENGTINLSIWSRKNTIAFTVSDTGCGIEKEKIKRVTERFYRIDTSRTKDTGGYGLGLAIVNASVKTLNGQLSIKSTIDKGTKMTITLPKA